MWVNQIVIRHPLYLSRAVFDIILRNLSGTAEPHSESTECNDKFITFLNVCREMVCLKVEQDYLSIQWI